MGQMSGFLSARSGARRGAKARGGRAASIPIGPTRNGGQESGSMMETHEGGCHCGRVRFRVTVDLQETVIGECNCSICTKKGILHLPVARGRLELLSGADDLTTYTFNTGTARHTFCRHCGIHPFYHRARSRIPRITASTCAASMITIPRRCNRGGCSRAGIGKRRRRRAWPMKASNHPIRWTAAPARSPCREYSGARRNRSLRSPAPSRRRARRFRNRAPVPAGGNNAR